MKTALIIALIAFVVGALILGIGWVLLQKNPIDKNVFKDKVYPFSTDELPSQINISTVNSRVEFRTIEGDEWRVECKDTEKVYHTVELVDGVLTIKQIDTRAWYEYIGIFTNLRPQSVIVYLPEGSYGSINIQSTSGGISVPEGFTFSDVTLKSTSGSISFASPAAGAMNVRNTSGSITVSGNVGGDLNAKNTSGDIRIIGGVNGAVNVTNGSGRIEIKDATPREAEIKNTSGAIYLQNVVCQEECEIENTSGGIELKRCDAASFDIENTSGGIRGSILSAKTFDCKTTSGSVRTPADGDGGTFKAKTTSGSIKITIAE